MPSKSYYCIMKIYYQGEPGSYSHLASQRITPLLNQTIESIEWLVDFDSVWEKIGEGDIGVLPIENSYAGSIHANVYHFLSHPHTILWEYDFEVRHCLLSLETDLAQVKEAYSHHQALSQTHSYLRSKNIIPKAFSDTAGAARMIQEKQKMWVAAIASELAWEIYGLNVLEKDIQDQPGNTTKFLVVVLQGNERFVEYKKSSGKTSLIFKTDHSPWSLARALEPFAAGQINLTKIESIPLGTGHFSYGFWVTFEWNMEESHVYEALQSLQVQCDFVKILWNY